MTANLPGLPPSASTQQTTETINALITDYNSGRIADLATALTDIAALQALRRLAQIQALETGAVNTGTATIPFDDTIPLAAEGNLFMSLSITPQDAASTLVIEVVGIAACSAAGTNGMTITLCQDAGNALAAAVVPAVANVTTTIPLRHVMTSGTTSATTFKVRMGSNAAGTTTFNGQLGGRIYGGVMASSIVIREYLP